jgi:hypothetical protein
MGVNKISMTLEASYYHDDVLTEHYHLEVKTKGIVTFQGKCFQPTTW